MDEMMTFDDDLLHWIGAAWRKAFQVGAAAERRRRRPNKGKRCPTVEQIKAKMGEGMEGGVAIFICLCLCHGW